MKKKLLISGIEGEVEFNFDRSGSSQVRVELQGQKVEGMLVGQGSSDQFDVVNLNGTNYRVKRIGDFVTIDGKNFKVQGTSALLSKKSGGEGNMNSPMPGKILKVMVKVGDQVEEGQGLMVMEAMKMEHTIKAAHAGVIKAIHYKEGDLVDGGVDLLDLEADQ